MEFSLILLVLGFLVSFYSISEDYKKRNLIFKFNVFDEVLMLSFFILLSILIFIQELYSMQDPQPVYTLFKINFSYSFLLSLIAFLIAIFIVAFFIIKLNSNKINQKEKFIENALDNLRKRRYSDLSADLDIFQKDILKTYKNPKESFLNKLNDFYSELIDDEDFIQYITKNNLNLALRLLSVQQDTSKKKELWEKIGTYLIKDKNSRLYLELNGNYSSNAYLLNFLFNDTSKCIEFLTWKPIGDFVTNYIEDQKKKKKTKITIMRKSMIQLSKNLPFT